MSEVSDKLINLIADMEEDEAVELARVSLDGGMPPAEMLEICRSAWISLVSGSRTRNISFPN